MKNDILTSASRYVKDIDKIVEELKIFMSDERYTHGEFILKRQNGKPVFIEMRAKKQL